MMDFGISGYFILESWFGAMVNGANCIISRRGRAEHCLKHCQGKAAALRVCIRMYQMNHGYIVEQPDG